MRPVGAPLRRGVGSALVAVGTAGAVFALTAPGGSSADVASDVALGAGVRAVEVDLAAARLRVVGGAGDTATLRVRGARGVEHETSGGVLRLRCAPGAQCGRLDIVLRVPHNIAVRGAVRAGSVRLEGLAGPVTFRSRSAALSAMDLSSRTVRLATDSGAVHVSLAGVARHLAVTSVSAPLYLTVPYAYSSDGYRVLTRTAGRTDLDISRSARRGAPRIVARSRTGDLLVSQRYPNMS